jgi:WD40 repeat protein
MTNTEYIKCNANQFKLVLQKYKNSLYIPIQLVIRIAMLCFITHPFIQVSSQDTGRLIADLDWSPNGQQIALGIARWQQRDRFGVGYPALDCEPVFGIFMVDASTQTVEFVDLNVDCSPSTIDFSPTGTEVAYTTDTVYGAIEVGARAVRLQVTALIDYHSFVWHPNGNSALLTLSIGVGAMDYNLIDGVRGTSFDERNSPGLVLPFLYSIWSPNGDYAASSTADGKIYVWQSGQVQQIFSQHTGSVRRFVWNPATNLIASGDDSGRILVWNPLTGESVMELYGHTGAILDIDWRADGQQIVSTSMDNTMRVWEFPSGEMTIVESGALISAVAYNPDGTELAYGGEIAHGDNPTIEIISVPSLIIPTPTPTPIPTATATPAPTQPLRLTALCSASPSAYRVWRVRNPNPVDVAVTWDVYRSSPLQTGLVIAPAAQEFRDPSEIPAVRLNWNPNGSMIAMSDGGNIVTILDSQTLTAINTLPVMPFPVRALRWSDDGTRLAVGGEYTIQIWNSAWDASQATLSLTLQVPPHRFGLNMLHTIDWNDSAQQILTTVLRHVYIWDSQTGQLVRTIEPSSTPLVSASWSPDGTMLGYASSTGFVSIASFTTNEISGADTYDRDAPWAMAWEANGNNLIVGTNSGTLQAFDFFPRRLGSDVISIRDDGMDIFSVEWHPTLPLVAVGYADGIVEIWNPYTYDMIQHVQEQTGMPVMSVSWSPDGTQLAYANGSELVIVSAPINALPTTVPTVTHTVTFTPTPTPTPTATPIPAPTQRLRLTALCSAVTWDVYRSSPLQSGLVIAPAAQGSVQGEVIFTTQTVSGANTVRIFVNGVQQDVKASNPAQC